MKAITRTDRFGRGAVALIATLAAVAAAGAPAPAAAQDSSEAAMIAAGRWALQHLPSGALRLDPHRTGQSTDPAVAQRIAAALGADLGTLEATRRCTDPTSPSTCTLESAALLAIAAPSIDGHRARVRVYAWYRQDSVREPVARASWNLTLQRTDAGWRVNGARLE